MKNWPTANKITPRGRARYLFNHAGTRGIKVGLSGPGRADTRRKMLEQRRWPVLAEVEALAGSCGENGLESGNREVRAQPDGGETLGKTACARVLRQGHKQVIPAEYSSTRRHQA